MRHAQKARLLPQIGPFGPRGFEGSLRRRPESPAHDPVVGAARQVDWPIGAKALRWQRYVLALSSHCMNAWSHQPVSPDASVRSSAFFGRV